VRPGKHRKTTAHGGEDAEEIAALQFEPVSRRLVELVPLDVDGVVIVRTRRIHRDTSALDVARVRSAAICTAFTIR
jgi:hypothetical protein